MCHTFKYTFCHPLPSHWAAATFSTHLTSLSYLHWEVPS